MRLVIAEHKIKENELSEPGVEIRRTGTYELFIDQYRACCRFVPDINGSSNVFEVAKAHENMPIYTSTEGYLIDVLLDRARRSFGDYVVSSLAKQIENKFSDVSYVLDMLTIFEKFSRSYMNKYESYY